MQEEDIDVDGMHLPLPDDDDDILEYKFAKFAQTHFQSNDPAVHSRRALKTPLLPLKNEGDQLVRFIPLFLLAKPTELFLFDLCRRYIFKSFLITWPFFLSHELPT